MLDSSRGGGETTDDIDTGDDTGVTSDSTSPPGDAPVPQPKEAVTLFLAGIAALIKSRNVSYALLGLGTVVLIAGVVVLIQAETY